MTGRHAAPRKRPKRDVESDEFAKVVGRFILAMERRASEDPAALDYFLTLQDEMRAAVDRAAYRLHAEGQFTLGEIAYQLSFGPHKMSRQNVIKRWGPAAMARKMNVPSITQRINARRDAVQRAGDELAARRAAKRAV